MVVQARQVVVVVAVWGAALASLGLTEESSGEDPDGEKRTESRGLEWSLSALTTGEVPGGEESTANGSARSLAPSTRAAPAPGQVNVLALQESGVPDEFSYARLLTPFPELRSFTLCYRIRLIRFREESTLISYAVSDSMDNELRIDHQMTGFKAAFHSKWAVTTVQTPLGSWAHFCFLYRFLTGDWNVFLDGELRAHGVLPVTDSPMLRNGVFVLGQEQDSLGGGFQRDQSYSGEITQLNLWATELSNHTIKRVCQCGEDVQGSALAWLVLEWQLAGQARSRTRPLHHLCTKTSRAFVYFPDRLPLNQALHLCQVIGGILAVPRTEEENSLFYQSTQSWGKNCSGQVGSSYLWLGANDAEVERRWVYWTSGMPIPWEGPWRGQGPNGGVVENCLVMLYDNFQGLWSDIACLNSYAFCVACEMEKQSVMYMKGPALCANSPFNLQYVFGEERGGRPSLTGFFHSDIFWDVKKGAWVLQSLKEDGAVAWWAPERVGMYPYGSKPWTLGADTCNIDAGRTVNLTLSVCGSGMFTCSSGSCIGLHQRCDLKIDCPDKSDEVQCSLVDILPGYNINIPPPPAAGSTHLYVYLTINILSFPSIATEDLTFVSTMDIKMQWKDTRLRYLNLKEDRTLNVVSDEYVSKIWTPQVFFSNARGNVFTNLDKGSRVECIQEGKSVAGGPDLSEEVNMFAGTENSLQQSQLYSVTYSCDFNLIMFPFDAQVCTMTFRLVSASAAYLTLVPFRANYSGQTNLVEYAIGRLSITSFTDGGFSSVAVQVRFSRRYGFYLLTLYIPTILLIFIAYATFFFNPDDFNSRITVCLTALLVLASLYTQTSGSLPKTSYFKLVDVWLFFSILMMFIIVLLQTLIDFYHQKMFDDNSRVVQYFRNICTSNCKIIQKSNDEKKLTNELSTYDKDSKPKAKTNGIQIEVKSLESSGDKGFKPPAGSWASGRGTAAVIDGGGNEAARRIPVFGRAVRRIDWATNQDVNMRLMEQSRVLIPAIFIIFNCTYWGAALRYVSTIDGGAD